jgi:hypothetical protein
MATNIIVVDDHESGWADVGVRLEAEGHLVGHAANLACPLGAAHP